MTLTKQMDWPALLDEARQQWAAGNAAGVRWCYNRLCDAMPDDVLRGFADLLATDPVAKPAHRPRRAREDTPGTVTVDQFRVPEGDIDTHIAGLEKMSREAAVRELLAILRHAREVGDPQKVLRRYKLHNVTDDAFERRALEAARNAVFLKSQAD